MELEGAPAVLATLAADKHSFARRIQRSSTGLVSFRNHSGTFSDALGRGQWSEAGASVLHLALLVLPTVGAIYVLARTAKRIVGAGWRVSDGRPVLRTSVVAGIAVVAATAVVGLWPDEDYRPIGPDERGTLLDATSTLSRTRADSPAAGTPAPATPSPGPTGSPVADDLTGSETDDDQDPDLRTLEPAAGSDVESTPAPTAEPSATPTPLS